jgi:hypothetical protein
MNRAFIDDLPASKENLTGEKENKLPDFQKSEVVRAS